MMIACRDNMNPVRLWRMNCASLDSLKKAPRGDSVPKTRPNFQPKTANGQPLVDEPHSSVWRQTVHLWETRLERADDLTQTKLVGRSDKVNDDKTTNMLV